MISKVLQFQLLRILAYIIITISYTKHNVSFWLLFLLFLLIELNVWIGYFASKRSKQANDEGKKLLEDMRDNLLKNQ